jgi:RES domain-containing protein
VKIEQFDPVHPPELVYVAATIPDEAVLTTDELGLALPEAWNEIPAPAADAVLGDAWITSGRSAALIVPSIHVPISVAEYNVLLNPVHPDFPAVRWTIEEFAYDRRLLRARAGRTRAERS